MPSRWLTLLAGALALLPFSHLYANPANKKSLENYLGSFITRPLDCRVCHQADPPGVKPSLDEVDKPHNIFGLRLKALRKELARAGKPTDMETRLQAIADEDSDGDGVTNIIELLTGHLPGDNKESPTHKELAQIQTKLTEFKKFQSRYRWKPFDAVRAPIVPATSAWANHPIDAFIEAERLQQGLEPRPLAPREALLRRVYLDLIGLPPTLEERTAFLQDISPDAYEKVVDRLLADPCHAERWARHWMDIWRYSDWAGFGMEVRESQPHIWRWRDWIIDSLHADKGYDQMVREMLAGDELAPGDPDTYRATGFLVRNWFRFNRNVWLDQTVEHTGKAFLGITMNCARCHDHMYDPIKQTDYYSFRAFFEPYQIRTDRVPGQPSTEKDGLARVYDADIQAKTFLLIRGNEALPDKDRLCPPSIPEALCRSPLQITSRQLPYDAYQPEQRQFILKEAIQRAKERLTRAEQRLSPTRDRFIASMLGLVSNRGVLVGATGSLSANVPLAATGSVPARVTELEHELASAELLAAQIELLQSQQALNARLKQDQSPKPDPADLNAALQDQLQQRQRAVAEARKSYLEAQLAVFRSPPKQRPAALERIKNTELALAQATKQLHQPLSNTAPSASKYPTQSSGRRSALAHWITNSQNPLAARVAVNHIWLRHMGQPLVPSVFDFGKNGQPPTHPALIDWLAAQFMDQGWSQKKLHKMIVMTKTYQMDSTPDSTSLARDPDNRYYWRRTPIRMEAEVVRDAVLHLSGRLDYTRGGPELDHNQGLATNRRSLYYRHANEKQMVFLTTFDAAGPTECYRRVHSVVPQQALALANSPLAQDSSRALARKVSDELGPQASSSAFISTSFELILGRRPTAQEMVPCQLFLIEQEKRMLSQTIPGQTVTQRARASLVHVLLNHHEFVTIR